MKAVAIFEWDLAEGIDPQDWHRAIQFIADALCLGDPKPVSCGLAIEDVAERILQAFHGVPVTLQQSLDTLAKRGIVKG